MRKISVIEYENTMTVALLMRTKAQPAPSIRKRLWYKTPDERIAALNELECTRKRLLKVEGSLSLSSSRLLDLPENQPILNLKKECLSKTMLACMALHLIDNGHYPSHFGLDPVTQRSLERTGKITSSGKLSADSKRAAENMIKTIKTLRGGAYSVSEIVEIMGNIEREQGALKAMRITGLSVLALIGAGYISSGMILNALFGRPYNIAWNKVTGYVDRLRKLGFVSTVFHDDTHTHSLTPAGKSVLDVFRLKDLKVRLN